MSSCKPNVGMAGVSHDVQPGPEVTLSFYSLLFTSDQHSLADAIYQKLTPCLLNKCSISRLQAYQGLQKAPNTICRPNAFQSESHRLRGRSGIKLSPQSRELGKGDTGWSTLDSPGTRCSLTFCSTRLSLAHVVQKAY